MANPITITAGIVYFGSYVAFALCAMNIVNLYDWSSVAVLRNSPVTGIPGLFRLVDEPFFNGLIILVALSQVASTMCMLLVSVLWIDIALKTRPSPERQLRFSKFKTYTIRATWFFGFL